MSLSKKRLWSAMNLGGLTVREAAVRTWTKIGEHEILTRAAAISFYAIAALVPFLALVITLTAWFLPLATWLLPHGGGEAGKGGPSPDNPLAPLRDLLPSDAASVLSRELARLQESPPTGIVSFGLVALLWLSSSLFVSIMDAMNRIMGVHETRPFWKVRLIAMLMTLSQAAILIVVFASTLAWPQILKWLGLSQPAAALATFIHTITVLVMILVSFAVANYFGPDADQRWEWITPGSLLGTLVILCISMLFRIYVQNWGNYSASYGSLAGVIVLMSWIWISSVVLLAAAELNKVIEDASPLGKPYGQRHENKP
jgi:membrane protein